MTRLVMQTKKCYVHHYREKKVVTHESVNIMLIVLLISRKDY